MSISSISSGFTNTYALLQSSSEEKSLWEEAQEISQEAASSGTSTMGTEILTLLSQVPRDDDGTLSFQSVEDYREQLGEAWDMVVMAGLEELGVDVDQDLPMTYDVDTGKVTVAEGTDNKELIDQYFEDNPALVEQFYDIVQLGKLTATASDNLSQTQMLQNLKLDTLSLWFEDNQDVQSWFDGGGLLALQGSSSTSTYTGLNLIV